MKRLPFFLLVAYIAATSAAVWVVVEISFQKTAGNPCLHSLCLSYGDLQPMSVVSRPMYHTALFALLVAICLTVPATAPGLRNLKTDNRLLYRIAVSLFPAVVLVLATVPVMTLAYWVGGVFLWDVVYGVGIIGAFAVTLACTTVACSMLLTTDRASTMAAYLVLVALAVATLGLHRIELAVASAQHPEIENKHPSLVLPVPRTLVPHPYFATADVLGGGTPTGRIAAVLVPSPFTPAGAFVPNSSGGGGSGGYAPGVVARRLRPGGLWYWSLAFYGGLSGVSLVVAWRRRRTIRRPPSSPAKPSSEDGAAVGH